MKLPAPSLTPAPLLHGPKMGLEEYMSKITSIPRPDIESPEQTREIRHAEISLLIDHKLGVDFPSDRRQDVFDVIDRYDQKHLLHVAHAVVTKPWDPLSKLGSVMAKKLSKVFTSDELEQYLGLSKEDLQKLGV